MTNLLRGCLVWAWVLLVLLVASPTRAQACDGAPPSAFFVVPPTGASFVFPYVTQDHEAGVASYTLSLARQSGGAALSVQTVTKASTTVVGPVTGQAALTCYAIPVIPVAQIPKGVPLVATLRANAVTAELSSDAGPPTAPFGSRLTDPALRPRP